MSERHDTAHVSPLALAEVAAELDRAADDLARLRELWEHASDIIYTHDLEGHFTSFNQAIEKVTGYTRDEALKLSFRDLVAPDHVATTEMMFQLRLAGEELQPFEVDLVSKSGERVPVEVRAHVIAGPTGKPFAIQGIARDVSERRRVEQALLASEDKFRQLVEQSLSGIYIIENGRFVYVNPRFAEIFGYRQEQVYQMTSFRELVWGNDKDLVQENLRKRFNGEVASMRYSFRGARADGACIDVEVHSSRTTYHGHTAVIGTLLDVTERVRNEKALRESEKRFRELLEHVQMIALVLDPVGTIQFVNDYFCEKTLWKREEILGKNWFDLFVPREEREARLARYKTRIVEKLIRYEFEHAIVTRAGNRRMIAFSNTVLRNEAGDIHGIASLAVDVTEQRQAEAALRESEERYALAAQGANDGLWDWNVRTSRIYFSPRWRQMAALGDAEPLGTLDEWTALVHPEDRRRFRAELAAHVDGRSPHLEMEHRLRQPDGNYRWVLVRGIGVRDATGRAYRVAGSQTDITDRKKGEEKLLHDALHDALTGLPNRALLMDRLTLALARLRRRADVLFAVLFCDLDRFKVVNDSLGHLVGDQLLVTMARRLEASVRPGDTVARFGGDEFIILLEEITTQEEAEEIALRVQKTLAEPMQLGGQEVFASASVGVALARPGYSRPEELLRDADTAMYRAKEQGRARHVLFDPAMHQRMVDRMQVEHSLRPAIERNEFFLEFQPVVNLTNGKLVGAEALIRWHHPTRGVVPPNEFIPIAEETGLIVPIGEYALRDACRQVREWQRAFPQLANLSVAVNLSARQFLQADLVARVGQALDDTQLDPSRLHLEITESVIMENSAHAAAVMRQLKGLGVHVHLDDFGTGYSSLAYLHQFQVDALKIDKSFVSRMAGDGARIVRAIVNLARDLGISVIAEGTETAAQVKQLVDLKCDYAQGFYFSPALRVADFESLVRGRRPPGPERKTAPELKPVAKPS